MNVKLDDSEKKQKEKKEKTNEFNNVRTYKPSVYLCLCLLLGTFQSIKLFSVPANVTYFPIEFIFANAMFHLIAPLDVISPVVLESQFDTQTKL